MPWRRVLSFGALPILSALAPLLAVPSITSHLGADGWSAIAIGQSLGFVVLAITTGGWGTLGPSLLAAEEDRPTLYRASLTARTLIGLPLTALFAGVAATLAPEDHRRTAAVMVVGVAAWSFGPLWYFISIGSARWVALLDAGPKVLAALVASVLIRDTSDELVYPVAMITVATVSAAAGAVMLARGGQGIAWSRAKRFIAQDAHLSLARVSTAAYVGLSVPLVALLAPSAVPAFAAADRLRLLASNALVSVAAGLQSWVFVDGVPSLRRQRQGVAVMSALGVIAAVVLVAGRPALERHLFSGVTGLTTGLVAAHAVALVAIGAAAGLVLQVLAPLGRTKAMAMSSHLGAAVGLPTVVALSVAHQSLGASVAIALTEWIVLLALVLAALRRRPSPTVPA
ncbi:hypothetical protein AFL01nite_08110 [Aeromicrobium flavum]|uniref:Uncharacterized protein n=2 Tax=Aeromicrobium flavum TaxID=416568 RepID=A0A512HSQ3_9ACTN|nr:hypothetical protein AFL01nite_08110 [Aeromicrobium flavum]